MKYLSQIAAVDAATGSYIFDRDVIRKILLYEVYRFFYIVIAHFTGFYHLGRGGGTGECIQKKVGMTDQVKWRFVWVIGNIEHFVHHDFPVFL